MHLGQQVWRRQELQCLGNNSFYLSSPLEHQVTRCWGRVALRDQLWCYKVQRPKGPHFPIRFQHKELDIYKLLIMIRCRSSGIWSDLHKYIWGLFTYCYCNSVSDFEVLVREKRFKYYSTDHIIDPQLLQNLFICLIFKKPFRQKNINWNSAQLGWFKPGDIFNIHQKLHASLPKSHSLPVDSQHFTCPRWRIIDVKQDFCSRWSFSTWQSAPHIKAINGDRMFCIVRTTCGQTRMIRILFIRLPQTNTRKTKQWRRKGRRNEARTLFTKLTLRCYD